MPAACAAPSALAADPTVKVPAPVAVKRAPAAVPTPAPKVEQGAADKASDKKSADKKAADKKEKDKKPKVLARDLFGKKPTASALAPRALGWSLFSFNLGVEIGQLAVVAAVASALGAVKARSERAHRRLAVIGSAGVVVAGAGWFVQRLFFP